MKIEKQIKDTNIMTFEQANDRYLGILNRISNIEDKDLKENMYELAHLTVGSGLLCRVGEVSLDTEFRIASFEKIL